MWWGRSECTEEGPSESDVGALAIPGEVRGAQGADRWASCCAGEVARRRGFGGDARCCARAV